MSKIETSCPECGAEYQLTPEQLAVAQGQIRCGVCMNIFQAIPSPAEETIALDNNADDTPIQDNDIIDDSVFDDDTLIQDDDTSLPELSKELNNSLINKSGEGNFFSDNDDVDILQREEAEVDESWTKDLMDQADEISEPAKTKSQDANNIDDFTDSLKLKQSNYNDIGFDENDKSDLLNRITPEPLEFRVGRDHSGIIGLFFSFAMIVLLIAAVFQTLYFQVDTLGRRPELRSVYASLCQLAPCQLPKQYNIKDLSAGSTHQKEHNIYQGALLVETVITNHAKFRQPFPHIDIYFKNMNDEIVAARSFKPSEYLRGNISTSKTMPVRQPIHLALELNDPGINATGYEVKLSYPE